MQKNQLKSILLLFSVSIAYSLIVDSLWLAAHTLDLLSGMFGVLVIVGIFSLLVPVTIASVLTFQYLRRVFGFSPLSVVTVVVVSLSVIAISTILPYFFPLLWATFFVR